jgi:hypothetical protein
MLVNGSTAIDGRSGRGGRRRRTRSARRRTVGLDRGEAIHAQGPGDVLDDVLAEILEGQSTPVAQLIPHGCADANAARLGQPLEAGGDVDAVTVRCRRRR